MEFADALPWLIGTGGVAALIFGALKFNRQDAGEAVLQAREVIASLRELIDEINEDRDRLLAHRDRLRDDNARLQEENDRLRRDAAEWDRRQR